jgi:translation elongation factor EF-Tu-like GTPase
MADFTALVTYYTQEQGGRKTPVGAEYNPVLRFENVDGNIAADQEFIGRTDVFPGESIETEFTLLHKDDLIESIYLGQNFELTESRVPIASGVVLEIQNSKLKMKK